VTSPFFDHSTFYSGVDALAQPYIPLGLLSLAACLKQSGHEVVIADLNLAYNNGNWQNDDRFYYNAAEYLKSYNSDLLGFLTAYDAYHHTINIATRYKEKNKNVPIVLGGYQATVTDIETIDNFSGIDVIVRGEGEKSILKVVELLQKGELLGSIPGITYRELGKTIRNDDVTFIENLNDLPVPAYDLYPISKYGFVSLEVGRGCPFKCSFCSTAPYWGHITRNKSTDRVIYEAELLQEDYGVCNFHLVHDLFTKDNEWVFAFCRKLKQKKDKIKWTCSSRTDTVSYTLLEEMAEAGCTAIYYGIETGASPIQKKINKTLDLERTKAIVRKTLDCGITPAVGFIAGFPFETEESLRATLNEFFDYKRCGVPLGHIFVATPEKGSELFRNYSKRLNFNAHFLDFPLVESIKTETINLIKKFPEIFCGFYRFNNKQFEPEVFMGLDEFSPLVNTLGLPVFIALSQFKDKYGFYKLWLDWVSQKNAEKRMPSNTLYYGTLQDMLDFLKYLYSSGKISSHYFSEILRYEEIKNQYRSNMLSIQNNIKPLEGDNISDFEELGTLKPVQNTYNKMESFDYDMKAIYEKKLDNNYEIYREPSNILFSISFRPMARISDFHKENFVDILTLKVDSFTKIIIELCDGKLTVEDIICCISEVCTETNDIPPENTRKMVLKTMEKLHALGILNFCSNGGGLN